MAVGNQPTAAQVNAQLTQLAIQWRNVAQQSLDLATTINQVGGSTGLAAGFTEIGFSSGDATAGALLLGYMSTLAGVQNGTVQQGGSGGTGAILFNFANALSALWAGM